MSILFRHLKQWAIKHYGIILPENTEESISRQAKKILDQNDWSNDFFFKAIEKNDQNVMNLLLDLITVQESYFFRDSALFDTLQNHILPRLIAEKREHQDYRINIWSAACSRGEEIYSLAICLHQLLSREGNWVFNLLGTDINPHALEQAHQGFYYKNSLRSLDAKLKKTYFIQEGPVYYLKSFIKDKVEFAYDNLAKPTTKRHTFDLIFCRNVLIYLTQDVASDIFTHFYNQLENKGLLFLGASEFANSQHQSFLSVFFNGHYCMQKNISFLHRHHEINALNRQSLSDVGTPSFDSNISITKPACKQSSTSAFTNTQEQAICELLDHKQYAKALTGIDEHFSESNASALMYRYKAQALMGLNQNTPAQHFLEQSLALDPLDALTYFLTGLIALDQKNIDAALNAFQKSLYLKPTFPEAAYYMGLIYLQQDDHTLGIKYLKKALDFASQLPNGSMIYSLQSQEQFMKALLATISYYEGAKNGK